jgi:hypothetical protein
MTFRSFLATTGVEVPVPDRIDPTALQSDQAGRAVRELESFTDVLDLAWQRFLECGGFPRAVGEHHHRAVALASSSTTPCRTARRSSGPASGRR